MKSYANTMKRKVRANQIVRVIAGKYESLTGQVLYCSSYVTILTDNDIHPAIRVPYGCIEIIKEATHG